MLLILLRIARVRHRKPNVPFVSQDGGKSCACAGFESLPSLAMAIRRRAVLGLNGNSLI
jgi:hypothetical protein